jgi:hypothetical protein
MSGNASVERLLHGFIGGMIGIGALIIFAWAAFWVIGAAGGVQMQMPLKLLYSGASLIGMALLLRWLVTAQSGARES